MIILFSGGHALALGGPAGEPKAGSRPHGLPGAGAGRSAQRIFGSFEAFGKTGGLRLGTPVAVTYGRALQPSEFDDPSAGKERYARAAERIMAAVARLEPPPVTVL